MEHNLFLMDVERIARSVGRREDAFGLQSRKLTTKSQLIPACLAAAQVCDWAHYFSPAESGLVQTFWRTCGDPRTTWSNRRPTSFFEVFRGFKGFEYLIFEYFWYLDMFSLFHSFPAGGSYFASVGRVLLNGRCMLILAPWRLSPEICPVGKSDGNWKYIRVIYVLFTSYLANCYLILSYVVYTSWLPLVLVANHRICEGLIGSVFGWTLASTWGETSFLVGKSPK